MAWGDNDPAARKGGWGDDDPVAKPSRVGGGDRRDKGLLRTVDAAVRGAADFVTLGGADEIAAGATALPTLVTGGFGKAKKVYNRELADQQTRDRADKRDAPKARVAGEVAGFVGTLGSGAVLNVGRAVPRVAPRATGLARATESVARNALGGSAVGAVAGAASSDPGADNRLEGAGGGAAFGAFAGAAAPAVSALAGRGVRAVTQRLSPPPRMQAGVNALARHMGAQTNGNAFQAEAARIRSHGEDPALVDVVGESGRGVIRAAASRMTPARESVQRFAEGRAVGLPDRISAQARRTISDDPRAPDQIRSEITTRRDAAATREYAGPYGTVISQPRGGTVARPTHELPTQLRAIVEDAEGRRAASMALRTARAGLTPADRRVALELQALLKGDASVPITAASIDRIRIAYRETSEALMRGERPNRSLARALASRVEEIDKLLDNTPGLTDARANYRSLSRQAEAVDHGETFLDANTDDFVAGVSNMTPDELTGARAAARRAVERKSGESTGAAPGVAGKLANALEQQMRNAALLGDQAVPMQEGMRAARQLRDNAQYIAPNTGSKTMGATQDAQAVGAIGETVQAARGGIVGLTVWAGQKMASAGLSDREAQALAELAIDPSRLDEALRILSSRMPPRDAHMVVEALRTVGARNAGEAASTRR